MRDTHGSLSRIRRRWMTDALALAALAGAGCATQQVGSMSPGLRRPPQPALVFENSGTDPVKLYLSGGAGEWLVGYLSPGETGVFPLPATVTSSPATGQFSLVVIPSGAARSIRAIGVGPSVIRSEPFASDYLTAVRWKVAGRWLIALPRTATP